ncbi:MAG: nadD [Oscillospiraceae bacterium]|nr:nadD [Oscillospiraceae bacterium]
MKKIAIFGGTFNPIHKGHISLAIQLNKRIGFDKIIVIPSNIPPHKEACDLASNEHRYQMCKLATQEYGDLFEVSDMEIRSNEKSYSIYTVEAIRQIYPNDEIYMILGSDMFIYFDKWYRFEDILSQVVLVTGARAEHEDEILQLKAKELMKEYPNARIMCIAIDVKEMCSTQIRTMDKNGQDTKCFLDKKVAGYIKSNHLYSC